MKPTATPTPEPSATAAAPAAATTTGFDPSAERPRSHLHRLLTEGVNRVPETPDGLTSHLPMALHALHALGAPDERLDAFQAACTPTYPVSSALLAPPALAPDWQALRGQKDSYVALRAHFTAALARDGVSSVLAEALPDLLTGAAASAFHGPIRTAHAVESGHSGELACALAYWAWRWQPVARPLQASPALDVDAWTAQLEAAALTWTPQAPLIAIRIRMAETSAPYQALAGALQLAPDTLARFTAWAAARYAATQSFTVLHMVTGLRAVGVLLPWAGAGAAEVHTKDLAHALTAAYLAARMSAWPQKPAAPSRAWEEIIHLAIASTDDHAIKMVHACRQFHAQTGDPVFQQAAERAVS